MTSMSRQTHHTPHAKLHAHAALLNVHGSRTLERQPNYPIQLYRVAHTGTRTPPVSRQTHHAGPHAPAALLTISQTAGGHDAGLARRSCAARAWVGGHTSRRAGTSLWGSRKRREGKGARGRASRARPQSLARRSGGGLVDAPAPRARGSVGARSSGRVGQQGSHGAGGRRARGRHTLLEPVVGREHHEERVPGTGIRKVL